MRLENRERVILHYGVECDGQVHTAAVVGPLSVADWFAMEDLRAATKENDPGSFTRYILEALSRRLVAMGEIPRSRFTPAWLEQHLAMPDLSLLVVAMGRLDERLESFRTGYESGQIPGDGDGTADGLVA